MSTIYILWLRQLKRYLRSKPRIFGSLAQPVLYLVALGFGFGPIYQKAGQGSYIQFLAPGIIAMSVLFTSIFSGIEVIWDRQFGFLKETLVAPVSRFQIMLGRTLGGATVAILQGSIVLLISLVVGFRPVSLAGVIFGLLIMALMAILIRYTRHLDQQGGTAIPISMIADGLPQFCLKIRIGLTRRQQPHFRKRMLNGFQLRRKEKDRT